MKSNPKLLRITTVPISLKLLLDGQFTFFQQQSFEVWTVSADGTEVQELKTHGIKHQVVNMTRAITPLRDLIALLQLIQVIRKFKPDIVHTHTPKAGLLGMMAAWMCGVSVRMHTVAGLPLMESVGLKRKVLELTERITYSCATNVYPNSKGLLQFIMKELKVAGFQSPVSRGTKPKEHKFTIIGKGSTNGINTNWFSRTLELENSADAIRQQYSIPKDSIVFSFVGRLVRDKGLVELVEAFQKLYFHAYLVLVGPFEEHLDPLPENVMNFLKTDPRVILAGFQQDVRPWMMASDVFVFPSYREGFPNVVMQAACLELPIIASDINGCNEIIQHQETGVLIPVKNTEALYHAMCLVAEDKSMRETFGKSSREFVMHNFERQFVWGELLKEYNRLLHLTVTSNHLTRHFE